MLVGSQRKREIMSDGPVYRATVWEADDGWHWRVEIDVRNGQAWNGVCESFTFAARRAAQLLRSANAQAAPLPARDSEAER